MKKLIFTALVAMVAVGGAFAQNYYLIGYDVPFFYCPPGITTCNIKYGQNPLVSPDVPPIQRERYYLSAIPWDGLN